MLHYNRIELKNLSNTISDWKQHFAELDISEELLRSAFPQSLPNLHDLYTACFKMYHSKQEWNHKPKFKQSWQLICLSSHLEKLINDFSALQKILELEYDNLDIRPLHYLIVSGYFPKIVGRLSLDSEFAPLLQQQAYETVNNGENIAHYAAWSGSFSTLQWVNIDYPDLMQTQTDDGWNIAHFAASTGSSKTLQWIHDNYRELMRAKNKSDQNIAHLIANSGSLEALLWVHNNYPDLVQAKVSQGGNIAHCAANFGFFAILQWIHNNYPDLMQAQTTTSGWNIAHCAAYSDSLEALLWVHSNYPDLVQAKTDKGENIAHCAAWGSSFAILQWVHNNYPDFMLTQYDGGWNIAHCAAWIGSSKTLQWIHNNYRELMRAKNKSDQNIAHLVLYSNSLKAFLWVRSNYPDLIQAKASGSANIAHCAAWFGSFAILPWIRNNYPDFMQIQTESGWNIAHFAANSNSGGSLEAFLWVHSNYPELAQAKTGRGENIAHCAAWAGSSAILQWIHNNYPDLMQTQTNDGYNITHYASLSGCPEIISFLINELPNLTAKFWTVNEYGDILRPILVGAVHKVISCELSHQDINNKTLTLLSAFKQEVITLITTSNEFEEELLVKINNSSKFKQIWGNAFLNIQPLLTLKAIDTSNDILSYSLFEQCVNLAKAAANSTQNSSWFNSAKSSDFIRTLIQLYSKIKERQPNISGNAHSEPLDQDTITTLSVIIDDYQRCSRLLVHQHTHRVENVLMYALLKTKTLKELNPKPKIEKGKNIDSSNYREHLEAIDKDLNDICAIPNALNEDVKQNAKLVVDGVKHLIEKKDNIIKHVIDHFGVLYYLDNEEKLPIHTDHTDFKLEGNGKDIDTEEYTKILDRIIENFIGAYYMAKETGHLRDLFGKLSYGFCLEGRIRDTFTWVVKNLSEIKNIDALMEKYLTEYLAYNKVMHGKLQAELEVSSDATEFIASRHQGMFCIPDSNYAPEGIITTEGIRKYIISVHCYDEPQTSICSIT